MSYQCESAHDATWPAGDCFACCMELEGAMQCLATSLAIAGAMEAMFRAGSHYGWNDAYDALTGDPDGIDRWRPNADGLVMGQWLEAMRK